MKNSSRSFVASYRGFGLLAGIILCVATFATVVWHAGAQGNGGVRREVSKKLVPGEGLLPADVDCSKIREKHIDMQENLAAGAILAYCGWFGPDATVEGMEERDRDPYSVDDSEAPFAYGGTDVNVKPSSPSIQSESFVWGNGTTVVAAYNDLATCTGGISTSTDGGVTWAVTGAAVCSGHGTNFGDPAVVYDPVRLKWVAMFLASGCGGQGIGAWNSTDGITWATAGCAANVSSGNGDRNSAWADNNPTSPFYGRVYASYNDFSLGGGALRTVFSTDGGTTWSTPVTVFASFRRDIQMTGDLTGTNGYVYLGGMDEGGGGANNRNNYLYRSTDGGVTWNAGVLQNPAYAPPGVAVCSGNSYFYTMTPQIRHMGWGQPAAGPGGVVHYVYAQHGTGADEGNIMYVRSTDSGLTWAAPIQLNTDAGLRAQWMPSISVSPTGAVFVKWYDRRDTSNNDYWIYGRASTNNGVSWQPDMAVSDAVIPQPTVQTSNCYMGDYDYHSSTAINNLVTWTDSRGSGSGGTQDVFFDKVLGLTTPLPTPTPTPGVPTPTPTITPTPTVTPTPCGANNNYSVASSTGATIVATSTDTGNHCDDCNTNVALPFSYSLYGQSFSSVNVDSNGNMGFTTADDGFSNSCLPDAVANNAIFPHWDDLRTDTGGGCASYTGGTCGIYTSTTGTAPNRIFNIEWRAVYFATATNQANFEVRLYEGQNRFDVIYGILPGLGASATVGVQKDTGSLFTQYECNTGGLSAGQQLAFTQAICGTPTPGATPTPTRTPTPTPGVTPSPTATATPSASPCGSPAWTAGATLPAAAPLVRSAGVYFPANGKFYGMGGRSADTAGSDYTHPFEYTPGTNTWVAKAATYPDNQVNNMACGVGTVSGTAQIYCVGGSAAGQTTATARVFSYNPVTDTIATLAAGDNWPGDAAGTILPGGFTVNGNKLYIIGGFNINVASTNQIWEFDPTAAVGSKWLQRVNTPVGIMYAPSAAIGGIIYVGGGSDYSGGTVIDTTNSFSFNPTANTIGAIAAIPRAVGETRGLNFNGKLLVMGGGRVAPNPSNIVNIYDPGTNTWTTGSPVPSFVTARRNFPTDTDGTSKIYLIGGYDTTGVGFVTTMEIFSGAACATPTPATTPTPAATPTPTPTVTPTPTPGASPSCSPAAWSAGPPQAPARYAIQGALGTDNMLYIAGGQSAENPPLLISTQVSRYNSTTNTWSNVAPLPVPLSQAATAAGANGKIYVAGGSLDGVSVVTNALRIYDIASNTWSSGPAMPTSPGVEAAASAVVNGKLYVMGGDDGTNGLNTNFVYDIAANTWTTGATLPSARTNTYGTAASNGMIYVYGGVVLPAFTTVDNLLRYNPGTNTWTDLGSAGTGGHGNYGGISPFGTGQLLITDGALNTGVSGNTTHIFTISSGTFSAGPSMIGNRAGHAQGTLPDGRVLVADGFNTATTVTSAVELLGSSCTSATPTPAATPTTTPTPVASPSASPTTTMQFAAAAFPGDEGQVEPVTITRTGVTSITSSVNFSATSGTATGGSACTSGVDFLTILNQPVQFNPGETQKQVFVTICGDTLTEPTETAILTLSSPSGGSIGPPNPAVMNINDTANRYMSCQEIDFTLGAPAAPYPSNITVSGGPLQISSLRLTLFDVQHQLPDNMDFLLVGPTGVKYIFMADAGGPTAMTSPATLTFSDAAANPIPNNGPLVTGSFKPVSWEAPQSNFAAPAPAGPYIEPNSSGVPTLASAFGFTNSNGTWSLFARDDNGTFNPNVLVGTISCWGLEFLQTTASGVSMSGRVTTAGGAGIRNARVTVSGNSLPEARVATTGSFGYFSFDGLTAGETYVVTVNSQRYTFTVPSRVITLVDNMNDLDFTADP